MKRRRRLHPPRFLIPSSTSIDALRDDSRSVIVGLQSRYAEETATRALKIRHNNMLGVLFIEVPQQAGETLLKPPHQAALRPSADYGWRDWALHDNRTG